MNDRQELFHTTNLKAATALVTLGFEMNRSQPVTRTVRSDGQESTVFWFYPENAEGEKAATVFYGMTKGGEALNAKDPENIVNYLRAYASNRDEMISLIRNTKRDIIIETNGRHVSIRESASEKTKDSISKMI